MQGCLLIDNSIEPKKTGKNGVYDRIYQSFYSVSRVWGKANLFFIAVL